MEWFVFLVVAGAVAGYFYFKNGFSSSKPRPSVAKHSALSMLPKTFVVFDLETSGLDAAKDEIIEIGAIRVNRDSSNHETFQALVKPTKKIQRKITEITGITQGMLDADGQNLESALKEFKVFIGDLPLIAYNAPFDMRFLESSAERSGTRFNNEFICALSMAKRAWPKQKSYRLGEFAKLGGLPSDGLHRALADCKVTLTVYSAAANILNSPT